MNNFESPVRREDTVLKKRRRPALSCVECRRRKVKCDRNHPCGPCTRMNSPACTYIPDSRRRAASPAVAPASRGTSRSNGTPSNPATRVSDFDSMLDRYVAPGILGPRLQSSPDYSSPSNVGSDALSLINALSTRVRELEERLLPRGEASTADLALPPRTASADHDHMAKSRFYGESHWMNSVDPFPIKMATTEKVPLNKTTELYKTVLECKRMARLVKSSRCHDSALPPGIESSIPPKEVCDQLVQCYLRTLESFTRTLHIPTFLKEYAHFWSYPASRTPPTVLKILLVLAIGIPFYTGPSQPRLHAQCRTWIHAAEHYLSAPHQKSRLNLTCIQMHILLLLARQTCSVDGDLIWISAGALLRSAMHLGLHRDPSHFPKFSAAPFHAEMRRRLWAAVLEICVQASLDMGMVPLISAADFDTRPPANVDDGEMGEGDADADVGGRREMERPRDQVTQCSIARALYESIPLRLEITQLLNNIRSAPSYDRTLQLSAALSAKCRENARLFQTYLSSGPSSASASPLSSVSASSGPSSTSSFKLSRASPFAVKLLDATLRRFLICLHRPFFSKAMSDPRYLYSQKICVDASLAILAPMHSHPYASADADPEVVAEVEATGKRAHTISTLDCNSNGGDDVEIREIGDADTTTDADADVGLGVGVGVQRNDWTALLIHGVGFVKSLFLYSLSTVYLDMIAQVQERLADIPAPLSNPPSNSIIPLPPLYSPIHTHLRTGKQIMDARISAGETNIKGSVFAACALARLEALVCGRDADNAVLDAARCSVRESWGRMRGAAGGWGRGEGEREREREEEREGGGKGDDGVVSGEDRDGTGTGTGIADTQGRQTTPTTTALDSSTAPLDLDMDTDIDWGMLMQDDAMDFDFDFDFGFGSDTSPDSWMAGDWSADIGT
ncbi:hypothetical protein K491DRAFT_757144 [Lophiostoma macrostomum CBS 122681]|uniref:Zn(2)-C6 fungal-type domain-containing protein n=1 Tax=Lophiostoma macrostomum CBS 122681 TaxID=1314788 RepID=A0A6A6TCP8_9PLEO|nr:hypothetical protein K491DRAFT_757144 [Lophiostoma macrostomum CBS 122681]